MDIIYIYIYQGFQNSVKRWVGGEDFPPSTGGELEILLGGNFILLGRHLHKEFFFDLLKLL